MRFGLFALFHQQPSALWIMFTGILLHGMCYDFIFVMGRMYVDQRAGEDIRGAAQGLHAIVTLGAGMFVGSLLSGYVVDSYTSIDKVRNWQAIWLVQTRPRLGVLRAEEKGEGSSPQPVAIVSIPNPPKIVLLPSPTEMTSSPAVTGTVSVVA